ncbi:MAG: DoxX family protein [Pseudomonadota bacterium]
MTDIQTNALQPSLFTRLTAPASATVEALADAGLRVAAGLFLVPHGAQKLFGAFGGYGLEATGQFFETQLGFANGLLVALAAGLIETVGGLLLALGLATRLVAVTIAGFLAVAASIHFGAGFFWTDGGWEFPALWAILVGSYAVRGGGRYSLDAVLSNRG